MLRFRLLPLLSLLIAATPGLSAQGILDRPTLPAHCADADERIEVMLLGSYHMSNPGADAFNLESDDVLAPTRQSEIQSVVDRLAEFAPTRVAVEAPWGDSLATTRYAAYIVGDLELRRSEEEQIGFRLAHQLGHSQVYPVDVRMGLDFESVGQLAQQDPELGALMGGMQAAGESAMATMAEWLASGTIGEMLQHMNDPDVIWRAHAPYLEFFVPIALGDDYAGADMVATWYQRNIRIFANLTRIVDSEDDRIFAVYGAGHIPIIRQLVIDHPGYCIKEPNPYLEGS